MHILSFSNGVVEVLALKVCDLDSLVIGIYRPPETSVEEWTEASRLIDEAVLLSQAHWKYVNLLYFGDFNFPTIKWPEGTCPEGDGQVNKQVNRFLRMMSDQFIISFVTVSYQTCKYS
jgi:hypothetical protein